MVIRLVAVRLVPFPLRHFPLASTYSEKRVPIFWLRYRQRDTVFTQKRLQTVPPTLKGANMVPLDL